jgi:hypothetical protein
VMPYRIRYDNIFKSTLSWLSSPPPPPFSFKRKKLL